MLIYRKGNNLWFLVHKNASTSLLDTLHHSGEFKALPQPPSDMMKCFKFAVVRDPIDRFISTYLMILGVKTHNKTSPFKNGKMSPQVLDDFIGMLSKSFFDGHLKPQTEYLPIKMDFYLDFAHLDRDFNILKKKIGITGSLPHKNTTLALGREIVEDWMTKARINKLKTIYKEDFKLYAQRRLSKNKRAQKEIKPSP